MVLKEKNEIITEHHSIICLNFDKPKVQIEHMPPLFKVFICIISGIIIQSFLGLKFSLAFICLLQSISFILASYCLNKKYISSLIIYILISLFGFQMSLFTNQKVNSKLELLSPLNDNYIYYFIKVNSQSKTANGFKLLADVLGAQNDSNEFTALDFKLLLYSKSDLLNVENSYLKVKLKVNELESPKNPFAIDFKKIFSRKNIYHQAFLPNEFIKVKPAYTNQNSLLKILQKYKSKTLLSFKQNLSEKNAQIASALILGHKEDLSKETKQIFANTGAAHILAVSGLHIGLIFGMITFLLNRLPKNKITNYQSATISLLAIWLFAYLTGMSTSVTRATLMLSIFLIGKQFSLFTSVYNIIALAGIIILTIYPTQLWDISFQFSFLALISILIFHNKIEKSIAIKNSILKKIWTLIVVSIAAQILVFPLSLFYFNQFPNYFWLSGIIAVPLAFIILGLGVIILILLPIPYSSFDYITQIIYDLLDKTIDILIFGIQYINDFPFSTINDIYLSKPTVAILYICILSLMFFAWTKKKLFLFLLPIIFIFLSTQMLISKKNAWHKDEIIVYHLPKKSLVEYISNGHQSILYEDNLNAKDLKNSSDLLNRNLSLIRAETSHESGSRSSYYIINDIKFIIDPKKKNPERNSNQIYEFIVLTKHSILNPELLTRYFKCGTYIIDGSVSYNERNILTDFFDSQNINYHITSELGAYIYNIKP